jgi:hypothetical protein
LPQPRDYEVDGLPPKLQLEASASRRIGIGADQFGAYAAGGISFMFSDLLNDHTLGATVQSTSRIEETGAQAFISIASRAGTGAWWSSTCRM